MADEREIRDTRVVIYMTEDDADELSRISNKLRFRSRSTFIVAMLERFLRGGFSMVCFFKVASQIQRRAESIDGEYQFEFDFDAVKKAIRPLPELPPEEDPDPKEVRANLKEMREELLTK